MAKAYLHMLLHIAYSAWLLNICGTIELNTISALIVAAYCMVGGLQLYGWRPTIVWLEAYHCDGCSLILIAAWGWYRSVTLQFISLLTLEVWTISQNLICAAFNIAT